MSGLELTFLAMTILGAGFLILSLVIGEIGDLIGGDIHHSGSDGPGWASPTVVAGALTGYGLTGFIAVRSGWHGAWAFLLGAAVAIAVAAALGFLLRTMARQQANSQVSRESYLDLTAVVTISIPPGGKGEVRFLDRNGVVVTKPAASTWSQVMPVGTEANIKRVLADHVVVSRT
jgi:hypothetical protein